MPPASPGERASQLRWICPSAVGLAALARPADRRPSPRGDVGLLIHWNRYPNIGDARQAAVDLLRLPPQGRLNPTEPAVHELLVRVWDTARIAEALAIATKATHPERAIAASVFAHLGWLAIAATNSQLLIDCRSDRSFHSDPIGTQYRHWGIDAGGIARRLARSWRLPTDLAALTGRLHLPLSTAQHFGADGGLFAVVQLAAALVDARPDGLMLAPGVSASEVMHRLDVQRDALPRFETTPEFVAFDDPYGQPLLLELLADSPHADFDPVAMEAEIDQLHRALAEQRSGEDERLRLAKLAAVAEFAAGAGHEINNPLAVISGHAQHLLAREEDPTKRTSYQTIIRQTQRIHSILSELMQFARPSVPQKMPLNIRATINAVVADVRPLAESKQIRVDVIDVDGPLPLLADARQIAMALTCLIRNGIEAAPENGSVLVRLERLERSVRIVIEDDGPGVRNEDRPHLFDPFFSGRSAGRGRGMGLPTAWRLAHEHGGDVWFEPTHEGPTRFVLTLPMADDEISMAA